MTRFIAKLKGEPISSATLGGKEYKAVDDAIELPDDHVEAHADAVSLGLERAPVEESHGKKSAK